MEGEVGGGGDLSEMSSILRIVSWRWEVRSSRRDVCCSDKRVRRVCWDEIVRWRVVISFRSVPIPSFKVFFIVESTARLENFGFKGYTFHIESKHSTVDDILDSRVFENISYPGLAIRYEDIRKRICTRIELKLLHEQ